jgi:DNA primase
VRSRGRHGAIKAYDLLHSVTTKAVAVVLPDGRDPADILKSDGPAALTAALHERAQPLATLVVDAWLDQWGRRLDDIGGQLCAMRDAAAKIATRLPQPIAERIVEITGGQILETLDENLRPRANPELPAIARLLPLDATSQIVRVAERLDLEDHSEVLAEVANALVKEQANTPKGPARDQDIEVHGDQSSAAGSSPAQLASDSFPASAAASALPAGPSPPPRLQPGRAVAHREGAHARGRG